MKPSVKSTPPPAQSKSPENRSKIGQQLAILIFAVAAGLYLRTLAPGLLAGDPGEFQFAAWRFGLAHPTGYPLYLLMGGLWQRLLALFGGDPAWALNLFSGLTGAGAVVLLFVLCRRWISGLGEQESSVWLQFVAAWAAILFILNPSFWSQAVIAEVYTLHVLLILGILYAATNLIESNRVDSKSEDSKSEDSPVPQSSNLPISALSVLALALLLGLSLTHHRTSLFLFPGVLGMLFWLDRRWWRNPVTLLILILGIGLPQLLYLYIPLRSGPAASPWLYQMLNGETLTLYTQTWQGFVDFVTGSVFAVSFLDFRGALARLPQMGTLWLVHFSWTGLLLIGLGLIHLVRNKRWGLLWLTVPFMAIHQVFNLFYGIGDIFVYYIALYVIGTLWAALGLMDLIHRIPKDARPVIGGLVLMMIVLFTLPSLFPNYSVRDQSGNRAAQEQWQTIFTAEGLPNDAILVSNDRNEIVPLYYLQAVEGQHTGVTGLFPLITQEPRFADVASVVQTALDAGSRPVYLIKPMAGLGVRFDLTQPDPEGPVVRVDGAVTLPETAIPLGLTYGPLTLAGYMWEILGDSTEVTLFWQVEEDMSENFTTTVQLFDQSGQKVGQQDAQPGGIYYPTSLWKPGELIRERHIIDGSEIDNSEIDSAEEPGDLLVALYRQIPGEGNAQPEFVYLAEPVRWSLGEQ